MEYTTFKLLLCLLICVKTDLTFGLFESQVLGIVAAPHILDNCIEPIKINHSINNIIKWAAKTDREASYYKYLESISPTFYERICANILLPNKVQTQNGSTKKLCAKVLYKKAARKMLMKMTPEAIFLVRLETSCKRARSQLGTSSQCFSHIPCSQLGTSSFSNWLKIRPLNSTQNKRLKKAVRPHLLQPHRKSISSFFPDRMTS